MKKVFLLMLGVVYCSAILAQQSGLIKMAFNGSRTITSTTTSVTATPAITATVTTTATGTMTVTTTPATTTTVTATPATTKKPVIFAIIGIGDLSTQTLSQINAAGKLSFYARPYSTYFYKRDNTGSGKHLTNKEFIISTFASFNVNATNKDTLIEGTILFPDLGTSSFLITPEVGILAHNPDPINNDGLSYYYGLLGEFTNKKIAASKKRDGTDTSVYFNVNSLTLGLKGAVFYQPDTSTLLSLTGVFYYNYIHIPDKDSTDFRYILKQPNLSSSFNSIGVKVTFGINDFQIYADMRHTYYNPAEIIPDRGLASFNANIGIIVPVTILKYPK